MGRRNVQFPHRGSNTEGGRPVFSDHDLNSRPTSPLKAEPHGNEGTGSEEVSSLKTSVSSKSSLVSDSCHM